MTRYDCRSSYSAENEIATKGDISAAALEWEDM